MVDNYDNVCSCCYDQGIDPRYHICEKCRRRIRDLVEKEVVETKAIVVEQKEGEVKNE